MSNEMNNEKEQKEKRMSIEFILKNTDMFKPSDYDRLEKQVSGHKYFLDIKLKRDVGWEDAVYSWMENVYLPISEAMETFTTSMSFPGAERDDVFFALCDHWYFMSEHKEREANPFDVAIDYDAKYGKSIGKILAKMQASHVA